MYSNDGPRYGFTYFTMKENKNSRFSFFTFILSNNLTLLERFVLNFLECILIFYHYSNYVNFLKS